jgi:hypothetical protein
MMMQTYHVLDAVEMTLLSADELPNEKLPPAAAISRLMHGPVMYAAYSYSHQSTTKNRMRWLQPVLPKQQIRAKLNRCCLLCVVRNRGRR